ncbi:MAG: hypothetical protein HY922_00110 [Elusimicrobia bacterium]|nr:hypothetical protein [Elusimicrobiota bacterium]
MAADFGARHQLKGKPLALGFSMLNVCRGMRFIEQTDPLPLTMAIGASYRLSGALQLAMDVRREIADKRTALGIGTEYAVFPAFSLRMGYGSGLAQAASRGALGALGGLGGGFGLKMGPCRADYTFTPFGELGNVQRISLGARF